MGTKQIVGWILVVGALNLGLVGLLGMNVVESVLGMGFSKIVYIVVGLAGVYKAYMMLTGGKK